VGGEKTKRGWVDAKNAVGFILFNFLMQNFGLVSSHFISNESEIYWSSMKYLLLTLVYTKIGLGKG